MSVGSNVEWTDNTWVLTTGCNEESSGCANCYARTMSKRLAAMAVADIKRGANPGRKASYSLSVLDDGRWSGVTTVESALTDPLRWKTPRKVFVNSMSDLFWGADKDLAEARRRGVADPKSVPFEFIDRAFGVMALCPQHTFQMLTKRPERMAEYFERTTGCHIADVVMAEEKRTGVKGAPFVWPLPNVWIGTSCENQATANARIPHLLRCPAAVRFLSLEPLLGPIDLNLHRVDGVAVDDHCEACDERDEGRCDELDWVIVGGESGAKARPCDVEWIRSIAKQCQAASVPVFIKQLGKRPFNGEIVRQMAALGASPAARERQAAMKLKDRKGGDMNEWPEDLRIRRMPKTAVEAVGG